MNIYFIDIFKTTISECTRSTNNLKVLIKIKRSLAKRYKRNRRNLSLKPRLKEISKRVNTLKRANRINYYEDLFQNASPKNQWRNINNILGHKTKSTRINEIVSGSERISDPLIMAYTFNDF